MKNILIFSCTVQGFKKLEPVVRALQNRKDARVKTVVCGIQEIEYCAQNGIPCERVDGYSDMQRRNDWDTDLAIDAVYHLLQGDKPDLLITIDSGGFMESMFRYCRQHRIKTVALQHAPLAQRLTQVPVEADRYLYWGDCFARQLHEILHVPQERIVVTGSAQFDKTLLEKTDRDAIAKTAGLDAAKKWYVFCGQGVKGIPIDYSPELVIQKACKVLSAQEDIQFVYKPHPGELPQDLARMAKKMPAMKLVRNVDTVTLLHEAEAAMTFYSTVAIDAALLGKPLLLFNRTDLKHSALPLYDMGAALCCDAPERVEASIRQLMEFRVSESLRRRSVKELNGGSVGQAADRIVQECIKQL